MKAFKILQASNSLQKLKNFTRWSTLVYRLRNQLLKLKFHKILLYHRNQWIESTGAWSSGIGKVLIYIRDTSLGLSKTETHRPSSNKMNLNSPKRAATAQTIPICNLTSTVQQWKDAIKYLLSLSSSRANILLTLVSKTEKQKRERKRRLTRL